MKQTLFVFFLIAVVLSCKSSINEKNKRNQDWLWWVDDETGNGKWIKFGNKTTVKNGWYTSFYFNGNVCEKGRIKDGVFVDTIYRYDIDGKLDSHLIIHGDVMNDDSVEYYFIKNGPYKRYHRDGTLFIEGIVQHHLDGDKWLTNYENGKPKMDRDVRGENGHLFEYYESGKMKIKAVGEFIPRNYQYIKSNDTTSDDMYYLKKGYAVRYYETGGYKDSVVYYDRSSNTDRVSWYVNGNIHTKEKYVDGKLNGIGCDYYENGQIKDSIKFVDGKIDGVAYNWYENGNLRTLATYSKGKAIGKHYLYHENGKRKGIIDGATMTLLDKYDTTGKIIP